MMKPGDINEDGKEIEQDGDVTWEEHVNESEGLSETVRRSEQNRSAM